MAPHAGPNLLYWLVIKYKPNQHIKQLSLNDTSKLFARQFNLYWSRSAVNLGCEFACSLHGGYRILSTHLGPSFSNMYTHFCCISISPLRHVITRSDDGISKHFCPTIKSRSAFLPTPQVCRKLCVHNDSLLSEIKGLWPQCVPR